jgi:hypothetical protein
LQRCYYDFGCVNQVVVTRVQPHQLSLREPSQSYLGASDVYLNGCKKFIKILGRLCPLLEIYPKVEPMRALESIGKNSFLLQRLKAQQGFLAACGSAADKLYGNAPLTGVTLALKNPELKVGGKRGVKF